MFPCNAADILWFRHDRLLLLWAQA